MQKIELDFTQEIEKFMREMRLVKKEDIKQQLIDRIYERDETCEKGRHKTTVNR